MAHIDAQNWLLWNLSNFRLSLTKWKYFKVFQWNSFYIYGFFYGSFWMLLKQSNQILWTCRPHIIFLNIYIKISEKFKSWTISIKQRYNSWTIINSKSRTTAVKLRPKLQITLLFEYLYDYFWRAFFGFHG